MKTFLLTMIVLALSFSVCDAQIRGKAAGSADANQSISDYFERNRGPDQDPVEAARLKAESRKHLESGRNLIGVDERLTRKLAEQQRQEFSGSLYGKRPTDFEIGDWGCIAVEFQTIQVVSSNECLLLPKFTAANLILLRGPDTSKVTDGVVFVLQHPVVICETFKYKTTSGTQKTVLVLDTSKFNELLEKLTSDQFRNWTDSAGNSLGEARFIEFNKGKVQLEFRDDGTARDDDLVLLSQLSKSDQQWVRDEKLSPAAKKKKSVVSRVPLPELAKSFANKTEPVRPATNKTGTGNPATGK